MHAHTGTPETFLSPGGDMYVSITDILAAVSTLIVAVLGVFLLVVKMINRRHHKDIRRKTDTTRD